MTQKVGWDAVKDGMRLRMKNFNILGVPCKIQFLRGGFPKIQYIGRELPKRGGTWKIFRFKRGVGEK